MTGVISSNEERLIDAVEQLVEELDREQGSGLISYKALVKLGALRRLLHEARGRPTNRLLMRDVVAVTGEGEPDGS